MCEDATREPLRRKEFGNIATLASRENYSDTVQILLKACCIGGEQHKRIVPILLDSNERVAPYRVGLAFRALSATEIEGKGVFAVTLATLKTTATSKTELAVNARVALAALG